MKEPDLRQVLQVVLMYHDFSNWSKRDR
jgi:hypothetical protein